MNSALHAREFQIWNCQTVSRDPSGALSPQRLPESIRKKLNPSAQKRCRQTANTEIRFFLKAGSAARVKIQSEGITNLIVFYGDFQSNLVARVQGGVHELSVKMHERLAGAVAAGVPGLRKRFHPEIVRICLTGDPVWIHAVDGPSIRRPKRQELPEQTLLCCGTSLTHGVYASAPHLAYPARLGESLNWDVLNLGLRGSMFCEPALADHIARRRDWDAVVCELSVNMTVRFSDEEFSARVKDFISRIAAAHPDKPVLVFSLLPHFRDLDPALVSVEEKRAAGAKRTLLQQAVAELRAPNIRFVDGKRLLRNVTGLSDDLLHLGDDGFWEVSQGLYRHLSRMVSQMR